MWPAEPERFAVSPSQGESEALGWRVGLGSSPTEGLWVVRALHRCSLTGQQSPTCPDPWPP